jgi:hypothetical protein
MPVHEASRCGIGRWQTGKKVAADAVAAAYIPLRTGHDEGETKRARAPGGSEKAFEKTCRRHQLSATIEHNPPDGSPSGTAWSRCFD